MQGGYGGGAGHQGYGAPPGNAAVPTAQGAQASAGFEFSPEHDKQFLALGGRLVLAGIMQIVWGVGQLVFGWLWGLGQWFYNLPISVALIAVGAMFLGVGGSFKKIAETQGNDVDHLMEASNKLSMAATVQAISLVVAMVLGAIVMVLGVIIGVAVLATK